MEDAATSTLDVLKYLLPGFIVAWIYFGLTANYRPDKFERIIQALVFSLFVQTIVLFVRYISLRLGKWVSLGSWDIDVQTSWSVIVAVVFGLSFSWCVNTDKGHAFFRRLRITKQTAYPSKWFGAFNDYERYVVLHMKGQRRLMGWPREWPNKPVEGHFFIVEAAWLNEDGVSIELSGNEGILVPASEVEMVEFLSPHYREVVNDKKAAHS